MSQIEEVTAIVKRYRETFCPTTYTPIQLRIMQFIQKFRQQHGFSPQGVEIANELYVAKVTIGEHLQLLEEKKNIRRIKGKARSIEVLDPDFMNVSFRMMHDEAVNRLAGLTQETRSKIEDSTYFDGTFEHLREISGTAHATN